MDFAIIVFVCLFILSFVLNIVNDVKAKKTTYQELLDTSKKLIEKGQFQKLKGYLVARPKLVLLHYDELIPQLAEYAREVCCDKNL